MVQLEYEIGDYVSCLSGEQRYPSKIVDIKEPESDDPSYVVHFMGWNSRYDVVVAHSKRDDFLQPDTGKESETVTKPKKGSKEDKETSETPSSRRSVATSSSNAAGTSAQPTQKMDEIIIEMPKKLRQLLINDNDMVNRSFQTRVPSEFPIDRIIADYIREIPITSEQMNNLDNLLVEYDETGTKLTNVASICVARGIGDYFNCVLAYQLLYKFERNQYNDIAQEAVEKSLKRGTSAEKHFRPSAYYGIVHLVRMIAQLPELTQLSPWSEELIDRILMGIHSLMDFLSKNLDTYYKEEESYEAASSEHHRRNQAVDDDEDDIAN